MTHSDVALDVEGGRPREPECLHVGVDHRLVHGLALRPAQHSDSKARVGRGAVPGALELGDQLLVHRTPANNMQSNK